MASLAAREGGPETPAPLARYGRGREGADRSRLAQEAPGRGAREGRPAPKWRCSKHNGPSATLGRTMRGVMGVVGWAALLAAVLVPGPGADAATRTYPGSGACSTTLQACINAA